MPAGARPPERMQTPSLRVRSSCAAAWIAFDRQALRSGARWINWARHLRSPVQGVLGDHAHDRGRPGSHEVAPRAIPMTRTRKDRCSDGLRNLRVTDLLCSHFSGTPLGVRADHTRPFFDLVSRAPRATLIRPHQLLVLTSARTAFAAHKGAAPYFFSALSALLMYPDMHEHRLLGYPEHLADLPKR